MITKTIVDQLIYEILGAAIEIHKAIGPGLLESVYHECMKIELEDRGIRFSTEHRTILTYKGREIDTVLKCDLFVEELIVVELKTVNTVLPVHEAQLLSYMNILKSPKGILINFQCGHLYKEGQKTMVNQHYRALP